MALTGFPAGPPLASPAGAFGLLQRVTDELARLTGVHADPAELIAGRAALTGLTRQGQASAGGSTRLLRAPDGWCAVTLSRATDVTSVPAVIGMLDAHVPQASLDTTAAWSALTAVAGARPKAELAAAAQLVGIPAAALPGTSPVASWPPWRTSRIAAPSPAACLEGAVVADLSSMWAGPLCARLLGLAGARVIKVESPDRPDGARAGNPDFYNWLHAGHEAMEIPFTAFGRSPLLGMLANADVVIEASRPRALAHLGLAPEAIPHKPGQVWLSITGYGRSEPDRVAFGDDAAVAGGLVGWTGGSYGTGEPAFCADAVADPLTGVSGALAVAGSLAAGGGELIDLPMQAVAAAFAAASLDDHGAHEVRDGMVHCRVLGRDQRVLQPRAPTFPRPC